MIQWCLGSSSLLLVIDSTELLLVMDSTCPGSTGLHSGQLMQPYVWVFCVLKPRKSPYSFLQHKSLWFFCYFYLLPLFILSLGLQYPQVFISKCLMLHSNRSIKYTKACRTLVEDGQVTMYTRRELPDMIGHTNAHLRLWKFATWRFICGGLSVVKKLYIKWMFNTLWTPWPLLDSQFSDSFLLLLTEAWSSLVIQNLISWFLDHYLGLAFSLMSHPSIFGQYKPWALPVNCSATPTLLALVPLMSL